jgi:DHA1 family tetracycline resistance protein-like MFS transporter
VNEQLSQAETHPNHPRRSLPGIRRHLSYRKVIVFLSACMALQMTSFVIILPLFARRFSQLGAGEEALATSTMAYALAATVAAPFIGAIADRLGRRLVVLVSLAAYVLAFTGYLFATSVLAFVVLRALAGACTAGLMPAVTGLVADLAPTDQRAQWIGVVNGGAAVGYVAGPVAGGWLYDRWGYDTALVVSIMVASVTLLTAGLMVPDIRPFSGRSAGEGLGRLFARPASLTDLVRGLRSTLPASLFVFFALLSVVFAAMFAYAFIEPSFMFYAYDNLDWTSSMLGVAISAYGTAFMLGEFGLGHLSDRLGRRPVILTGLVLFTAQFVGLAAGSNYAVIAASFAIAGLGNALFDPAVSAAILDITPAEHQARALGFKSTSSSLGSVLGPALVVLVAPLLTPQAIFLAATGIVGLGVLFFLSARMQPRPEVTMQSHNPILLREGKS